MKTEDGRLVIFHVSDERNDKKLVSKLYNVKSPVIEISLPTVRVPNSIRVETEHFSYRFKSTKVLRPQWMEFGKALASVVKHITPGQSDLAKKMFLIPTKEGMKVEVSDELFEEFKCLSPGWFKADESEEFVDFLSDI